MDSIDLKLPWPPTANTYWRRNGNRYFISEKGLTFRDKVCFSCRAYKGNFKAEDKLAVTILAYPPDKRKRDLDNLLKCTLDSLQHAQIFVDDNQICELTIIRMDALSNGLSVNISIY